MGRQINKIFILNWVHCGRVTQVMQSEYVQLIQKKKKELSKMGAYKNGFFEIRTKEGLKAKPILKQTL